MVNGGIDSVNTVTFSEANLKIGDVSPGSTLVVKKTDNIASITLTSVSGDFGSLREPALDRHQSYNSYCLEQDNAIFAGAKIMDEFKSYTPFLEEDKVSTFNEQNLSSVAIDSLLKQSDPLQKRIFLFNGGVRALDDVEELSTRLGFPLKECSDWERYVVRRAEWYKIGYGSSESQKQYGQFLHESVVLGTHFLRQGWGLRTLLSFYALRRWQIANDLKHDRIDLFGYPIATNDSNVRLTKCIDKYEEIGCSLLAIHQSHSEGKNNFYTSSDCPENSIELENFCKKIQDVQVGQFWGIIDDKKIPLSSFLMIPNIPENKIFFLKKECNYNFYIIVVHTSSSQFSIIMNHADKLFREANDEENSQRSITKLGELFWWLCQCKPYERGDPSIAEMLIRTIIARKFRRYPSWKEGVIPWGEVMKSIDVSEFGQRFHTLFEDVLVDF